MPKAQRSSVRAVFNAPLSSATVPLSLRRRGITQAPGVEGLRPYRPAPPPPLSCGAPSRPYPPPDPLHPKAHLRPHPRSLLPEATFGPLVREVGQTDCQPPPGRTATYDQQAGCCQRVQERLGHRAQAAAFRTHARLGWVGTGRVCPDTTRPLRRRHRRGLTPCWERPRPVFFVGPACDGGARWGTHPRACPCA